MENHISKSKISQETFDYVDWLLTWMWSKCIDTKTREVIREEKQRIKNLIEKDAGVWFVLSNENVVMNVCSNKDTAEDWKNRAHLGYYSNCRVEDCKNNVEYWKKRINDEIPRPVNKYE